jgi:hypothetical protein
VWSKFQALHNGRLAAGDALPFALLSVWTWVATGARCVRTWQRLHGVRLGAGGAGNVVGASECTCWGSVAPVHPHPPHTHTPTPTPSPPDGSLLVTSRMDPLFLLLPALEAAGQCFSPLSTVLSYAKCPAVTNVVQHCGVGMGALAAVCDVDGAWHHATYALHSVREEAVPLCCCKHSVSVSHWLSLLHPFGVHCLVSQTSPHPFPNYPRDADNPDLPLIRFNEAKATSWLAGKVGACA